MSQYGDDENGMIKNNLHDEMVDFLKDHPVSELLDIMANAITFALDAENRDDKARI